MQDHRGEDAVGPYPQPADRDPKDSEHRECDEEPVCRTEEDPGEEYRESGPIGLSSDRPNPR